jgi:sodium/bile acid cotransporter 7
MIFLAWLTPISGDSDTWYLLENLSSIGISFIFFFYGLKLSTKEAMKGLSNYKLHLVVQLSTFILFPLIVISVLPFIKTEEGHILWLTVFFLSALPSTVSSSVVMVSIAKGNISGAIFNASISGLLGILITPMWMGLFLNGETQNFNFIESIQGLLLRILLPVILGLTLNFKFGSFAKKHSKTLSYLDKTIILTIVYNSFNKSFQNKLFEKIDTSNLLILFASVILLFVIIYFIIGKITDTLKFNKEDKITALFSGSKKSLVHGTVMSKVLFKNMASQGLFLIPIMIYHAMQLIVISTIAQKMREETE